MFAAKAGSQSALVSFVGAVVWAGVATLAGARQAPMGVIELMLLFGTLVVVPLTLELGQEIGGPPRPRLATTIRVFQPLAATATVAALWVRPGIGSAALSTPWSLLGLAVALNGLATLARRQNRSLVQVAIALAGIDLAIAGAWLVASRAGLRPMGFQEPIVLLTAVHFHYIGFATAILAAGAVRLFEDRAFESNLLRPIVWLTLFLPFVLAAGFVLSPMVRMMAAVALAFDIVALTGLLVWLSSGLVNRTARAFLRLSGTSALIGLILAGVYAVSDHVGRPFTMLGMTRTHGLLSGLGFVLLGTLAFWIEIEARSARKGFRGAEEATEHVISRKPPCAVSRPIPEFVAREFYDR